MRNPSDNYGRNAQAGRVVSAVTLSPRSILRAGAIAAAAFSLTAGSASAFTLKQASLTKSGGRLVYSVVVCTSSRAKLSVSATFSTSGVKAARPAATQYQDKGCWPAVVGTSIARRAAPGCNPLVCPVLVGHLYTARVRITDLATHQSKRAPKRRARV
jgi:hypothetical protein